MDLRVPGARWTVGTDWGGHRCVSDRKLEPPCTAASVSEARAVGRHMIQLNVLADAAGMSTRVKQSEDCSDARAGTDQTQKSCHTPWAKRKARAAGWRRVDPRKPPAAACRVLKALEADC